MNKKIIIAIAHLFVPSSVETIISGFVKAQKKLQRYIEKHEAILERNTALITSKRMENASLNMSVDRAYRVINNIDQLVA